MPHTCAHVPIQDRGVPRRGWGGGVGTRPRYQIWLPLAAPIGLSPLLILVVGRVGVVLTHLCLSAGGGLHNSRGNPEVDLRPRAPAADGLEDAATETGGRTKWGRRRHSSRTRGIPTRAVLPHGGARRQSSKSPTYISPPPINQGDIPPPPPRPPNAVLVIACIPKTPVDVSNCIPNFQTFKKACHICFTPQPYAPLSTSRLAPRPLFHVPPDWVSWMCSRNQPSSQHGHPRRRKKGGRGGGDRDHAGRRTPSYPLWTVDTWCTNGTTTALPPSCWQPLPHGMHDNSHV